MNNQQHKKVRYVKCPKCGRVLPEPEQVPLYKCGGCDTILQAKYYRSNKGTSVPSLPSEHVHSNGNVHGPEVGKSSSSSQKTSGEQSPIQNEESNEKAIDDCNSEQIGDRIHAHHTSMSEESSVLEINRDMQVIVSRGELGKVVNKEAEKIPMEIETREDKPNEEPCNGVVNVNYAPGISTRRDIEAPGNRESQLLSALNGAKQDENDQREHCDDIALDGQKEVGHGNSEKATSMPIKFQPNEESFHYETLETDFHGEHFTERVSRNEDKSDKEVKGGRQIIVGDEQSDEIPLKIGTREDACENIEVLGNKISQQLGMVNESKQDENDQRVECEDIALDSQKQVGHENYEKSIHCETLKTELESERTTVGVSGNETNHLVEDKLVESAKIGKEDESGKQHKGFIERIREKLASVTISSDGPTSTEAQNATNNERIASDVSRDPDCEINLLDNVEETLGQKAENYDDSEMDGGSGQNRRTDIEGSSRQKDENYDGPDVDESGQNRPTNMEQTSRLKAENYDDSIYDRSGQNRPTGIDETSRKMAEKNGDSEFDGSGLNRPVYKVETSDPVDKHEKGGHLHEGIPRSPTERSPAYDGSVSSCDGNDVYFGVEENPESDSAHSSRIKYGDWRTRAPVKSSSRQISDEMLKHGMVREQELVRENDRNALFPPRVPFHRRSSEMAFETGSSSSYVHDQPLSHLTQNNQYRYTDREPWPRKMHPERGYTEGRRFSQVSWRDQEFLPTYYNDEISGELDRKKGYRGYSSDGRRQSESLFLSGNLPKTRYSGEMYNGRYQPHGHYMHRYPDPQRWSVQLPSGPQVAPPAGYYLYRPMTYMDPSREASWDPYDPYPTNMQRFSDIDSYGWGHDTVYLSDDQRSKEQIMRRPYIREKRQAVKRHLRPMAGGAPFITCYLCFKVLQLPEEFLLCKQRKIHRLKCGFCSNVLKFSLENESRLAPHLPYTGETNSERDVRPGSSSSHANQNHENTRVSKEQSRQVEVTWELPARSKSPLHRLMGYSTPQDLLTADDEFDDRE